MDLFEQEGCASAFLRAPGLSELFAPQPFTALAANDIRVEFDVPAGSKAWANVAKRIVHLSPDRSLDDLQLDMVHEGTHILLTDLGVPEDEQEDLIPAVGLRWIVPRRSVEAVVRECGELDADRLLGLFPHVSATEVLLRAGLVTDTVVITRCSLGRHLTHCFWREVNLPERLPGENRLVRAVRRTRLPTPAPHHFGRAWPYEDATGRPAIVVVSELSELVMAGAI